MPLRHTTGPGHGTIRLRVRPALRAGDVLAFAWVALWTGVSIVVGLDVSKLSQISRALDQTGSAVVTMGHGIGSLSHLPLVGSAFGQLAKEIVSAGSSTSSVAHSTTGSVGQLSYLLALVIALVPVVPTLAVYLPVRVQRRRDLRAVRRALAQRGPTEALEMYLARRAIATLPFHQLEKVTDDPWADLSEGRLRPLANAELRRLGLGSDSLPGGRGGTDDRGR